MKTTPKDFFMHLGATVALYVSITALINLAFSEINYYLPDALSPYFSSSSIAWPISVLVILVPVLYILEWFIGKDIMLMNEKKDIWIRRWRIFLTLFLSGALAIGDLIVLINTFLNGDTSTRFFMKVIVVLIVATVTFWFYVLELYNPENRSKSKLSILPLVGILLVILTIITGFVVVGSPTKQRNIRFDQQRVYDLMTIQRQVADYWQKKGNLPQGLAQLSDPLYGVIVPVDPENSKPYSYKIKSAKIFEICADFALANQNVANDGLEMRNPVMNYSYPIINSSESDWMHTAGNVCFDRTIDPDKFPPLQKI